MDTEQLSSLAMAMAIHSLLRRPSEHHEKKAYTPLAHLSCRRSSNHGAARAQVADLKETALQWLPQLHSSLQSHHLFSNDLQVMQLWNSLQGVPAASVSTIRQANGRGSHNLKLSALHQIIHHKGMHDVASSREGSFSRREVLLSCTGCCDVLARAEAIADAFRHCQQQPSV